MFGGGNADDAIVGVSSENYGHLRFAANSFTTSGARENVSVGVTVWIGNKRGAASTNYSRFWAKQKGKEPTPGPVNSIMESSQSPVAVEDMIKSMDRGILLGRFWYIRGLDPRTATQTGLTRDGIWYIEKGKIQYPVKNFRFNQSVMQLLAPGNVDMIGKPERVGGSEGQGGSSALLPALKVKEFHFSSQSEAV